MYKIPLKSLAKKIMDEVYNETKIYSTCGIGPNMLLAKIAMDTEAKKNKSRIAEWNYSDVESKLWQISPLSKMWGIGRRYEKYLNSIGCKTVGDVAKLPVERLKKKFGVVGEELWYHTHGIDMSLIQDKKKVKALSKSYGIGQVLHNDYNRQTCPQIILEMSDELSTRLRATNKAATVVHLTIRYSKDYGGGFAHQAKADSPIYLGTQIQKECLKMFDKYYKDEPIRGVMISLSGFVENSNIQLNLFDDAEKQIKEEKLFDAMDKIKKRYGKNSVRRASTEYEYSTAKERNEAIGGHHE